MNQQTTLEKMKQLRLFGMATLYHQSLSQHLWQDCTPDQFTPCWWIRSGKNARTAE